MEVLPVTSVLCPGGPTSRGEGTSKTHEARLLLVWWSTAADASGTRSDPQAGVATQLADLHLRHLRRQQGERLTREELLLLLESREIRFLAMENECWGMTLHDVAQGSRVMMHWLNRCRPTSESLMPFSDYLVIVSLVWRPFLGWVLCVHT